MGTETNRSLVTAYALHVSVRDCFGRPILEANITFNTTGNPYDGSAKTNKDGLAELPLFESDFMAGDKPTDSTEVEIKIGKRHHGPLVKKGENFKNGLLKVKVVYQRNLDPTMELKEPPATDTSPSKPVLKVMEIPILDNTGKPVLDKKKKKPLKETVQVLEVVLMEAGPVGTNPLTGITGVTSTPLVRRMTSFTSDTDGLGEVQKELLYGIAQGDIALTPESAFTIVHAEGGDDYAACTSDCKLKATDAKKKVSVKDNTLAGVQFIRVADFSNSMNTITWGKTHMNNLNQRLVVGLARLCRILRDDHQVTNIYTQGFITANNDAHQHGRAMDFSGAAREKPEKAVQSIRTDVDLIVVYHWGNVHLQVQDTAGTIKRRAEDGKQYHADGGARPPNEDLLYRLDPEPQPSERNSKTKDLPQSHFTKAKEVFLAAYQFCTAQFSSRDAWLGPSSEIRKPGTPAAIAAANECDANDALDPGNPGLIKGYCLHPEYPKPNAPGDKDGRQAHRDHIHMQLGKTYNKGTTGTWED